MFKEFLLTYCMYKYEAGFHQSFDIAATYFIPWPKAQSLAQSSIFHTSGLERDYRQDEFPTRQDELFPTRQDEFPTAYIPNDGQVLHYEDRSTFHPSGLERDCRQDEFPTRLDEFPTIQDEFPTA